VYGSHITQRLESGLHAHRGTGSMAFSIAGPPDQSFQGQSGEGSGREASLEPMEGSPAGGGEVSPAVGEGSPPEGPLLTEVEPRWHSMVARGLSFPFKAHTGLTKRSTAPGSFWSSMFRTSREGRTAFHTPLTPPISLHIQSILRRGSRELLEQHVSEKSER